MRLRNRRSYRDAHDTLIYVHIGKCGGETLWDAIRQSPKIKSVFRSIRKVHINKPPLLEKARYLVVVRNPVSRALSAFNWRYKLVVEDAVQSDRIKGELAILQKYKTLNALAEALYTSDGSLDPDVAKEFRTIHHLREDISFYLSDLLKMISPKQIYAVLTTEALDKDIKDYLEIDNVKKTHDHRSKTPAEQLELSDKARANLRMFLHEDYTISEALLDMAGIDDERRTKVLA